jgi:predicted phage tail protein
MTVMAVAQTDMSIAGQKAQQKAQEKVQANASEVERRRHLNEMTATRIRQAQEAVADAQKLQANRARAKAAKATAITSAGEAGVTGQVVNNLLASIGQQEAQGRFAFEQQAGMRDVARDMRLMNMGIGHQQNMLRINKPIQEVDYLGSLIEGAQFGMQMGSLGKEAGMEGFFGQGSGGGTDTSDFKTPTSLSELLKPKGN